MEARNIENENAMTLTVIVPVYRVEPEYLRQCLDGILEQTFNDFELIIVDDGAPEENGAIIDEYAAKDGRIVAIHQANAGASAARNAGLQIAKGKYITFVDSDDTISLDTFAKITERAEKDKLDVLMWGMYRCFGENKKVPFTPYLEDIDVFDERLKEEVQYKCMVGILPFFKTPPASADASGSCCAKLYRRQFLENNDLHYTLGLKRAEDMTFNLKVFEAADRIGYLYDFLYYYRQLETSATYQYRENGIEVFTDSLREMRKFIWEKDKPKLYKQIFYMRCMFFYLESMDMDYLNRDNPKPLRKRLQDMKSKAIEEPYKEAFDNLEFTYLTFARRIPLVLIRHNQMALLALFYSAFRLTKKGK